MLWTDAILFILLIFYICYVTGRIENKLDEISEEIDQQRKNN